MIEVYEIFENFGFARPVGVLQIDLIRYRHR
jgi:hypothetical protein